MSKSPKKKQKFDIDVIKTPEGQVPTVDSFHKVVDGLFGEVLDTRKDIAKLLPNLEKELDNLREILAEQMIIFEIISRNIEALQKELNNQAGTISKILKASEIDQKSGSSETLLADESKKEILKLITSELKNNLKPINDSISDLDTNIKKSSDQTMKKVSKDLESIKDQIDDLSSKTELQMLEILESVNQEPSSIKESKSSSSSKSSTKKKLTS
ncbi:MAG: hypothetical protein FK734_16895 [Asgard group archaeon]|nr:hypothetical protein [Asgard group archaeon]